MRVGFLTATRAVALMVLLPGCIWLMAGCCTANLMLRSCPARIDLRLTAGEQLNSCIDQGSYQVMVQVYSLADTRAFHAAEFEDLWHRAADLDGVLDVMRLTVEPGSEQDQRWPRPAGTRAVAVVANFCRLDAGCWRQLVELDDGSQRLDLALAGTCMTLAVRP